MTDGVTTVSAGDLPSTSTEEGSAADKVTQTGAGRVSADGDVTPVKGDDGKILGKFENVEALAKAYQELEKKQSAGKETSPDTETKTETTTPDDLTITKAEKPDVDWAAINKEYAEKGTLSDETKAALVKAGIPESNIDVHIAGLQALAEKNTQRLIEVVGSKEKLVQLLKWAGENLSEDAIGVYNEAYKSGNMDQAQMALEAINARFVAAHGSDASASLTTTTGQVPGQTGGPEGFGSVAEITAAMGDPRYSTDAAYRAKVIARMGATPDNVLGPVNTEPGVEAKVS